MCCVFFLCGCGKIDDKDVVKELEKNITNKVGYKLEGTLEILNNDEVYVYDISVGHKKDDYYKVVLTNQSNNHSQVILKNDDGVFILTPSLNKSFKFQSDWPYNNSQIYLLDKVLDDINNDAEYKFKKTDKGFEIINKVNYPNNKNLVKEKIVLDDKYNIKKIYVYDADDLICMKMVFDDIDYSPKFSNDYFEIDEIMSTFEIEEIKETSIFEETMYPLFIPDGTKLTNEERIKTDFGERVILTFEGDKSFLLVEETASVEEEFTIIPTFGEPYQLMDTLGVMTDTSLSWTSNGVEYYLISEVMEKDELIEVAQSIYELPVTSIK